jgi:hypothetical protein
MYSLGSETHHRTTQLRKAEHCAPLLVWVVTKLPVVEVVKTPVPRL